MGHVLLAADLEMRRTSRFCVAVCGWAARAKEVGVRSFFEHFSQKALSFVEKGEGVIAAKIVNSFVCCFSYLCILKRSEV